ncbi:MAG: hypothetical protein LBT23_04025 [Synergistaceae bacterium]|nr:hypothetical protein [Synergistaceae bacterium]
MAPELSVFPVITGVMQDIAITLPSGSSEREAEVLIEAQSGWGVLMFSSGPSGSGSARCSPGVPYHIKYRWAGAPPVKEAARELIKVTAPDLGISAEASFNVGIDLQIEAIVLPEGLSAGVFSAVDIQMSDTFNPDADVTSILKKIGASPEISMSLVPDSTSRQKSTISDPVVRKFFGDTAEGHASYPADALVPGSFVQKGNRFVWLGEDGRTPGITPPSCGTYHIEAVLKSNVGGVTLKHWSSPVFTVSTPDPSDAGADMPPLVASTLGILSRLDRNAALRAAESFSRGSGISSLGKALCDAFSHSPAPMLGKYTAALDASGRGDEEIAGFMGEIVKGFPGFGVTLVTKNGLGEWSVAEGDFYEGDRFIAIPFEAGRNLTIRLTGSGAGDVSLWKIIPQGVNAKKYPSGKWIKEITVYTSEVLPPQNAKMN